MLEKLPVLQELGAEEVMCVLRKHMLRKLLTGQEPVERSYHICNVSLAPSTDKGFCQLAMEKKLKGSDAFPQSRQGRMSIELRDNKLIPGTAGTI